MIEASISTLPPAPLHVFEIWSNAAFVAKRFHEERGTPLPAMGRSWDGRDARLMRFEPTVWLVEGEVAGLADILGEDGALTAIGGSIVRVRLRGAGWRRLLMEGGVFDAENPGFGLGDCAATVIDHVGVRLFVEAEDACLAYVPASFAHDLVAFWERAVRSG